MREVGKLFGIGDSAACAMRKRIAKAVVKFFGADLVTQLMNGSSRPGWVSVLQAVRERSHSNEFVGAFQQHPQPVIG